MAVSVLGEKLREMFDKADDILFDSAEKARAGDEQRLYMDTMRIVRVQRAKIIKAFEDALKQALAGIGEGGSPDPDLSKLDDMSQWSLQDGDALEERIAVSNMQTKATSLHSHELVELQRRLARLSDLAGDGGMSPESMSPVRIIRAFQDSMRDLSVEFPIKLVIYKLFDRVVVGRLSEVFVGANQLLAVHGIEPSVSTQAATKKTAIPQGPHPAGVPSWATGLDSRSVQAFLPAAAGGYGGPAMGQSAGGGYDTPAWGAGRPMGWGPSGHGQAAIPVAGAGGYAQQFGDEQVAHEIAQILGDYAQGRMPARQDWIPPENVALVARMFDSYYRDPRLSEELKPMLARLQVPATKAALADKRFFADPQHPTRRTINDLFEMLLQFGSADAPPPQLLSEVQGLVDAAAQAFHLDPAKLRAARPPTVDERTADDFLLEQQNQQQRKNRSRVERVRRIVSHELKRRIGDRAMAPGVVRLMLSGFGPLLCLDYIRSGIEGASWNQTMGLVDRVLASLGPRSGSADMRAAEEAEIVASISRRLTAIGFSDQRLEEVISGLLQAYLERAEAAYTEVPAPVAVAEISAVADVVAAETRPTLSPIQELQGLLSILLVPGGWYTVLDATAGIKHWVRVRGYYPAQNAVMLGHYMEDRYLRVRANAFATDLVEGRAMPIDPSSDLQGAIARLAEVGFERGADRLIWTGADGKPVDTVAPAKS